MSRRFHAAPCLMALVVTALMCTHASARRVLLQHYDFDTLGSLPADWTFVSGSGPNTVVQNGVPLTPTPPNVFQNENAIFGTFNINQGNPGGLTVERFLTPNARRAFRLVVRTRLGGPAQPGGGGGGID